MEQGTAQPETPKLTPKQRRFVDAYCGPARFNLSEAARLAGYSPKTAASMGSQLYKTPYIRACIDAFLDEHSLSTPAALHELTDVALRGLDESVEVRTYGDEVTAKMDASAKMKALELLLKARGAFTEKHQVDLDVTRYEIVGIADEDLP